jgi:hypothetical protein
LPVPKLGKRGEPTLHSTDPVCKTSVRWVAPNTQAPLSSHVVPDRVVELNSENQS